MSKANLEHFRQLVLQDTKLQQRLRDTPDSDAFMSLLIELGQEKGYGFTTDTVQAALNSQRRLWLERWL